MQDHASDQARNDQRSTRLKFRSACDSCAASKVRCQKQQPICSRCEQLGLECIYGRSQRKGKPASYATKAAAAAATQVETSQLHQWQMSDSYDNFLEALTTATTATTTSGNITPDEHVVSFTEPCQPSSLLNLQDPMQTLLNSYFTQDFSQSAHETNSYFKCPPPSTTKFTMSGRSISADMDIDLSEVPNVLSQQSSGDPCITQALSMLSSLYQLIGPNQGHHLPDSRSPASSCPSSSYPSGDVVLLTTRGATHTLSRLLACTCPFCSNDANMPFLLSITAAKCLSWYQALYLSNIRGPQDPGSRDLVQSSTNNQASLLGIAERAAAAYMMPLGVGAFSLPRATEMRMKAQMLLCELQPLIQACNLLSSRVRSDDVRSVRRLSESFVELLQRDLAELRRNLENICSQML